MPEQIENFSSHPVSATVTGNVTWTYQCVPEKNAKDSHLDFHG
jgi:hypothetical protein